MVQGKHHNYKEFIFIQLVEVLPTAAWREASVLGVSERLRTRPAVVSKGLLHIITFNLSLLAMLVKQREMRNYVAL